MTAEIPQRCRPVVRCLAVLLGLGLFGCGGEADPCATCPPPGPADPIKELQLAYQRRDMGKYTRLLADDFTFCFDPKTHPVGLPPCWDRAADSAATARLFAAADISDIRIDLAADQDTPVNEPGKLKWRRIRITNTFLEVDKVPPTTEVITYRVDGDKQDFYFRKGRSPADTLATSPTSKEWFLVAWNDLGRLSAAAPTSPAGPQPAVETTTWGSVKLLFAN